MVVDQVRGDGRRTRRALRSQGQTRQRIRGDVAMLRPDLAPGDRAILVRVEAKRKIEIA